MTFVSGQIRLHDVRADDVVPPVVAINIRSVVGEGRLVEPVLRCWIRQLRADTGGVRSFGNPCSARVENIYPSSAVRGMPLCSVRMPPNCQFATSAFTTAARMGKKPRVTAKRQLIQTRCYRSILRIELRKAALSGADVIRIVHLEDIAGAGAHAAGIVDRLSVCERAQNGKALAEALLQPELERVVVGIRLVVRVLNKAERGNGRLLLALPGPGIGTLILSSLRNLWDWEPT